MLKSVLGKTSLMALACLLLLTAHAADSARVIDVPAGDLLSAIEAVEKQADVEIVYQPETLKGLKTHGVSGNLTTQDAVRKLLAGTQLRLSTDASTGAMLIVAGPERDSQEGVGVKPVAEGGIGEAALLVAQADTSGQGAEVKQNTANVAENSGGLKLEEIVVTAQRYEQKLEDVPISISAFTGKELDMSSETSVNDALYSVPGLNITTYTAGGTNTISIRGVHSFIGSNTVGYYVDAVPFGFVAKDFAPDPGTFDLDRVEVLRGPQGTLYGANSLNGVVRVLTKDADLDDYEFKGRTLVSNIQGGGENFGADAVVNVPIVSGKLAARLMVSYDHKGGYIDNLVADEINDGKLANVRLKINGQPTENLSVKLGYWRSRSDLGSLPMSLPATDLYPGNLNPHKSDRFDVYSGTIAYDFGSFTASNTASYMNYLNEFAIDWSAFSITGEIPFLDGLFDYSQPSKVFTNELALNSQSDGPWAWSAGAIYRDAKDVVAYRSIFGPGPVSQDESNSYAIFGELTRYFADGALELTGGLRYFDDKVHQSEPGGIYSLTSTFEHISPRTVLTWHPNNDMTVYASYAQGFRSGLNQPAATEAVLPGLPPAKEDTLDNFEIGSKGKLFDGFLNYEVAAYYIHWSDVKQPLCTPVDDPITGTSCQFLYTNTGTANGPGFDVALTFHPARQLSVAFTGSWNDLQFTDDVFFGANLLYNKGDRLALSSKYTLGGSISYRAPLGSTGLEGGFAGYVNYKPPVESVEVAGRLRGDVITDTRLGLQIANPDVWTFEIYSDNVLNERGIAVPGPAGLETLGFYSTRFSPRTIGAQFSFHFQ
jgi:outer membrane receptor protein involved in Fe transport